MKDWLHELIPSVDIPEGKLETAEITHFEISDTEAARYNLGLMIDGQGHRAVTAGQYTRLTSDGKLQMTDTPAEKLDHMDVVKQAQGRCLIMGLGIGMVAQAMAMKPDVTEVVVIEINQDVIDLVHPYLQGREKITVICADAHTWTPQKGEKFDVIWHDIWPSISLDDCESRNLLSRRFARRWTKYHGAWAKDEIRRQQQQDRNMGWWR